MELAVEVRVSPPGGGRLGRQGLQCSHDPVLDFRSLGKQIAASVGRILYVRGTRRQIFLRSGPAR